MTDPIRRVVTGHDSNGKAVIVSDGPAPNRRARKVGGFVSTALWVTETAPADFDGPEDTAVGDVPLAPPPAGTVFRIVDFPPVDEAALLAEGAGASAAEIGAHSAAHGGAAARHPFMHRTDSVDYAIVLTGEIDMLLDEDELHLSAGDVIIQRGTNHAWVNRGSETCRMAFVLVDAKPGGK